MRLFTSLLAGIIGIGIGVAHAAEDIDAQTGSYIASLCAVASQENAPTSADDYVAQIERAQVRGQSPSAISKPTFDRDEAHKVATAWMTLSDEVKKRTLFNPAGCESAVADAWKKQS
ncbi:hypothetical protein PMPD1_2200 [Paramixta manurensis]|uniref:Uncharacterized protein n=1 Tax=Paramixta manurensis TaxID=2740817 RepID=A0A6M8U8Y2_9GAMM|nr:hypothetical protein PMPD1_2200 [Erwiniaceae bacterium PD-1]